MKTADVILMPQRHYSNSHDKGAHLLLQRIFVTTKWKTIATSVLPMSWVQFVTYVSRMDLILFGCGGLCTPKAYPLYRDIDADFINHQLLYNLHILDYIPKYKMRGQLCQRIYVLQLYY